MRVAGCPRICRAPILPPTHNSLHPKRQRLISSTPRREQEFSSHNTSSPYFVPPPESDDIPTAGPRGSPDYIPRKRGYAPNIPIPARKFNLPAPKVKKPFPDPDKQAPEAKPRAIRTVQLEYERQLHAMRRGYVQWRVKDLKQKHEERLRKAARPRLPQPPAFKPTFAEAMASASQADQLVVEKRIFSALHRPKHHKAPGEGYRSEHHQTLLAKQKKELVNNYLALYHTARDFISTPEQLETEVVRAFQDTGRGFEPYFPQSYHEILRDVEEGTAGGIFEGYTARKYDEMGNDLYNAMMGTVAHGGPGYDEVMGEIQAALSGEEITETETTQKNSKLESSVDFQEGITEDSATADAIEMERVQRLKREEEERRRNVEILNLLSPPPGPDEPIVLATDLDALDWQRKDVVYDQKARVTGKMGTTRHAVPIDSLNWPRSLSESMPILGDEQPISMVLEPPTPTHAPDAPTAKELEALQAKFFGETESITIEQQLGEDVTSEFSSVTFKDTSPVSETESASLVDETPEAGIVDLEIPAEQVNDASSTSEQLALPPEFETDLNIEDLEQVTSEKRTVDYDSVQEEDLLTSKLKPLKQATSQTTIESRSSPAVDAKEVLSPEEEQAKLFRLRERYRNGFSNIKHKYGFMPTDPEEPVELLRFPSYMQAFITQSTPPSIVDQAEAHQKSKNPLSRSHSQILRIPPTPTDSVNAETDRLDSARKQFEQTRYGSKFPELSDVDSSEEALQYLIERERFEEAHPARKARQARNKEAWKQPVAGGGNGNGNGGQIPAAVVETEQDDIDRRFDEVTGKKSMEAPEKKEAQTMSPEEVRSPSEFESHLDASQRKILEEIRARRESRRADLSKKQ